MGGGFVGELLACQANKPILDRILKEAGFDGDNAVSALLAGLEAKDTVAVKPDVAKPVAAPKPGGV